jgi:tetratricopeptide (TPR) repeat protein
LSTNPHTANGIAALRRGDAKAALAFFNDAIAAGDYSIPTRMAAAQACRMLGDMPSEAAALDAVLGADKRNLSALLAMGDLKRRLGDDRAAAAFFRSALQTASARTSLPPSFRPLLADAQEFISASRGKFEAHLLDRLARSGISAKGRIGESLDLLLGRRQLYLQQPSVFYFPGLPQRQFFERGEFEWARAFEAAASAMRAELDAILADGREFDPYVMSNPNRPRPAQPLLDDPSWGVLYFWKNGTRVAENADRAPETMKALALAPMPVIGERSPIAHYSLLKPGTHIKPHHGMLNTRLICHLPLIVPEGCALRVGNETRSWREGELMIFDDSFEHEAWNRSNATRIILLFEIWRPELSDEERAGLVHIYEAIGAYDGASDGNG